MASKSISVFLTHSAKPWTYHWFLFPVTNDMNIRQSSYIDSERFEHEESWKPVKMVILGHFWSFLRLLRSFRPPKAIYCYFLFLYLFILLRTIIADHLKQFFAFEAI